MLFIVGPCSLESFEQVYPIVDLCQRWGLVYFRAQLFKPRTYPHSFQGLGKEGLPIIQYLMDRGLKLVCEACSLEQLEVVKDFASIIQIGARNMQNFELLKSVGRTVSFNSTYQETPYIMLKRGFGNDYKEWVASAQYLLESGVPQNKVVLCERGSRNAYSPYGMDLDFALALHVKQNYPFQLIIDPSHGSKHSQLVLPLAKGALAMGFDGIMVEIHPNPKASLSDAQQAVGLDDFERFLGEINYKQDLTFAKPFKTVNQVSENVVYP